MSDKRGKNAIDLTGKKIGRWLVLFRASKRGDPKVLWYCRCECGKEKNVVSSYLLRRKSQSCGCFQRELMRTRLTGENSPGWNGGKYTTKKGYVKILTPEGYKPEHRIVMEKSLGRKLLSTETVHHKNGVRNDNRIENLELWTKSHSDGQRVSDLIVWAEALLKQYAPEKLICPNI